MDYIITKQLIQEYKSPRVIGKYNIYHAENSNILLNDDELLLLDGFVFNLEDNIKLSLDDLVSVIKSGSIYEEKYTGQFSIIYYNRLENRFQLVNDFIGIRPVYYGKIDDDYIITNNYTKLLQFEELPLDITGLIQLLSPPYYSCIGGRSPFLGIKTLMPGTQKYLDNEGETDVSYDRIPNFGTRSDINTEQIKENLKENGKIYRLLHSNIELPISGGVDSRITLFSVFSSESDTTFNAFTYGESDHIDNQIAAKICGDISCPHRNTSINSLYPEKSVIDELFHSGGNLLLALWIPVLQELRRRYPKDKKEYSPVIVLGDIFDLLRAKNIKTQRTIRNRILNLFGVHKDTDLVSFTDTYRKKLSNTVSNTCNNYQLLCQLLNGNKETVSTETLNDFEDMQSHIEKLLPVNSSGNAFEELFNIYTWGRLTMANQANILNQTFETYVVSANRHFVRYILEIDWRDRFEDSLTHRILADTVYGKYPTTQIPYLNYNRPLLMKYLIWALRAQFDRLYDRWFSSKENRGGKTTINTINWRLIYSEKQNKDNFYSYFAGWESEFTYLLKYYARRAAGTSKALDDNDLTTGIRVCEILRAKIIR
jgi:hypothetical protein